MSAPRGVEPAVLDELAIANHILAREGVLDAFGHISVRDPTDPDQYLISRSLGPERVTPDAADFGDTNMLVRTQEHGRSLARSLGNARVGLMRGHGGVVVGSSVQQTIMSAIYAELNARLLLQALALGQVHYLSDAEIESAGQMLSEPLAAERAWTTWRARVEHAQS